MSVVAAGGPKGITQDWITLKSEGERPFCLTVLHLKRKEEESLVIRAGGCRGMVFRMVNT